MLWECLRSELCRARRGQLTAPGDSDAARKHQAQAATKGDTACMF
jgi:hypothetical protein